MEFIGGRLRRRGKAWREIFEIDKKCVNLELYTGDKLMCFLEGSGEKDESGILQVC